MTGPQVSAFTFFSRRATPRRLFGAFGNGNHWLLAGCLTIVWLFAARPLIAQSPGGVEQRSVVVELYYRESDRDTEAAVATIRECLSARRGVMIRAHDLDQEEGAEERLGKITSHFQIANVKLPVVYGCNQVLMNLPDTDQWRRRVAALFRVDVYVRSGCPHCADAKRFLAGFPLRYPGLEFRYFDVALDYASREAMQRVTSHYRRSASTVPVFHLCNQLVIGFDSAYGTGRRIESILAHWTVVAPSKESDPPKATEPIEHRDTGASGINMGRLDSGVPAAFWLVGLVLGAPNETAGAIDPGLQAGVSGAFASDGETGRLADTDLPELPLDDLPLPGDLPVGGAEETTVHVPFWGDLDVRRLGLPLFTLAVGLVDGFNPCAMWVLLFLLSILVNLKDRRKILTVAGTFVVISGIAYYAFMAAWLNVFLMFGLLRWAQIALAVLAITVGSIHVKDFFAFKRGLSLSIPESAKPGIYARVRRIVNAENLWGALAGASVLAVLVNVIELLCTAGLPAMYTEILTMRGFPVWINYLYLGLYILAYMFDDALMVAIVTITLGKRKLQETQGRWLKLVSGAVILLLGVVMLVAPDWLV